MNKKLLFVLTGIAVVIVVCLAIYLSKDKEQPIGGQRDTHGCLIPAGYSYNEKIDACIREWELEEEEKELAEVAVRYAKNEGKDILKNEFLTIDNVRGNNTVFLLDEEYNRYMVTLNNSEVERFSQILMP